MSHRFALIGCGRIGERHASLIQEHGELIAICDTDAGRMHHIDPQGAATRFTNHREMLAKSRPDLVVLCTPNGLHALHTIDSLQAGSHVLCEKPMAIRTADCQEMIVAAEKAQKRLFVVKQNRYNPPVAFVRELLDKGKLGNIASFQIDCLWNRPSAYYNNTWKGSRELDGGILFTQFSHFIDLLYWFLGPLEEASGFRQNRMHQGIIQFEDAGVASLRMKQGAIGSFHFTINTNGSNKAGSMTLVGDKGTVKIGGSYLNTIEYLDTSTNEQVPEFDNLPANNYGAYQGSMSNHHLVYRDLLKALENKDQQLVEAREAMQSVRIIEEIYRSTKLI